MPQDVKREASTPGADASNDLIPSAASRAAGRLLLVVDVAVQDDDRSGRGVDLVNTERVRRASNRSPSGGGVSTCPERMIRAQPPRYVIGAFAGTEGAP